MHETLPQSHYLWWVVTHMGSAGLLLPVMGVAAAGLWQVRQTAAARVWLLAFALAVVVTLTSKILFMGWGLGIAALDFTGISGHTLLATSVLPVLFSWLLASEHYRFRLTGVFMGLLLGATVGVSRVVLGQHSGSEVVIAWLAGLAVSGLTVNAMRPPIRRPWFIYLLPLALLLAFGGGSSNYLPTHDWEVNIALFLSGRDTAYTRQHLLRPERIGSASGRIMTL